MPNRVSFLKPALALCFASAFLLLTGSSAFAQNLSAYNSEVLAQAERAYQSGSYDETIKLTKTQLREPGISPAERVQAYRLQGLSYSAQGNERKARRAAQDLVILYPTYQTTSADSPEFAALVQEAQEQYENGDLRVKSYGRANKFILGTAIALSVLTIAVGIQSVMMTQ